MRRVRSLLVDLLRVVVSVYTDKGVEHWLKVEDIVSKRVGCQLSIEVEELVSASIGSPWSVELTRLSCTPSTLLDL